MIDLDSVPETALDPCAPHVERFGEGLDVVLVHGWGLHGGVWTTLVASLRDRYRLTVVDLPGHGESGDCGPFDLAQLAAWLGDAVPGPRVWVGWSLGALACLQLALDRPHQVRGLVLMGATPRFTTAPDWHPGVTPQLLDTFAAELHDNPRALMMRFLGLQVQGSASARESLKALRAQWAGRPMARLGGLRAGLEILRRADMRAHLPCIQCPTVVIAGERDRLVPPEASAELAAGLDAGRLEVLAGSGHAPFVAQPDRVAALLDDFLCALPAASAGSTS